MNPLISLISEDGTAASISSARVTMLVIVLPIMVVWTYVSIRAAALQPIPIEHLGLALGAMGIKAWQRGRENSPTPTSEIK